MNAFCERLALAYPFVQAPMAGVSTPALALAVSGVGALGSLATGARPAASVVAQQLAELQSTTDKPFNVNAFCLQPAALDSARGTQWLAYLRPVFEELGSEPPTSLLEMYPSLLVKEELLRVLVVAAQQAHEPGFAVQWAGTGAGRARALPAAELVRVLATELQAAMPAATS